MSKSRLSNSTLSKSEYTGKDVAIDIFSGLGIYTGLALGKYVPGFMMFVFVGTVILTLIGISFIVCRKIKNQDRRKQIIFRRFIRSTQLVRRNVGIAGAVVLLIVPVTLRFGDNMQLSEDYMKESGDSGDALAVHEVYGDEYGLAENFDKIKLIRDDEIFRQLSYDEKCEVVTAVLRCEGHRLGLEKFEIKFEKLDIETRGQFCYADRTITINARLLKDGTLPGAAADEILTTCLHECRHYFQDLMLSLYKNATPKQRNLLVFTGEDVASWYENSKNYHGVNGDDKEDFYDYASQPLEADSRQYAREQIRIYHNAIDQMDRKD